MVRFMEMGGFFMWPIWLFGLITLVTASLHAWRPKRQRYSFLRAMARATTFMSLGGFVAGTSRALLLCAQKPEWSHNPDLHLLVMQGLGEALCNLILGFSIVGVCWFITAFGERRAERNP